MNKIIKFLRATGVIAVLYSFLSVSSLSLNTQLGLTSVAYLTITTYVVL